MKMMTLRGILPLLVVLSACAASNEEDFASGTSADTQASFQPSRFQDIQAALGGTIPYPPEKFIDALLALEPESNVIASILPHGRSLERTATDFRQPRSMFLWQDNASRAPYRLFVGYTPGAEQLEIISWNSQRRQFDYFVVAEYEEGKPSRVVRPPRAVCTSCHQSGNPIFARAPWNESTANGTIRDKVAAESQDSFSQYLLNLPSGSSRVSVQTALYDLQVRNSTKMTQQQKICANACGGDLECRKGLLLAALFENIEPRTSSNLSSAWKTKMSQAMRASWPSDGFALIDSIINDRTVDLANPLQFDSSEDPLVWGEPGLSRGPSAGTGELLPGYATCWSFSREQMQTLQGWGASKVEAAMATEQLNSLAATWLPTESAIMTALTSAVSAPQPLVSPTTVPWAPKESTPPPPTGERPRVSTQQLFQDYCGFCHSGPSPRPQILPLSDLAALGRYVGSAGRTVRGLMNPEHLVMPPTDADQPTPAELQQMLADLPSN